MKNVRYSLNVVFAQILTSLVEEFGEKVAQIILHPLSTVQGGKTVVSVID